MNEPNTPAEGTTPTANHAPMPRFWWLNPWSEAIAWHRRAENAYRSGVEAAKKYAKLAGEKLACNQEVYEQANRILSLHRERDAVMADNVRIQQELNDACEQANKAGDDIEKMAAKCLELEQKVMELEVKWPRDLWHGGKIYGDVYTCQPYSKTHNEKQQLINERDNYKAANESLKADLDRVVKERDAAIFAESIVPKKAKRKPVKKKGGKR